MSWNQTTTVNTGVQAHAGWCLTLAKDCLSAPAGVPTAWASWEMAQWKHYDRDFPAVAVPCYFSHMGDYDGSGQIKNWGHVVVWIPGSGFLSSPGSGYGQQWFGSIEQIEQYFRCTFVGWTEDINGMRVAEWVEDGSKNPAPAPAPTPRTYTVVPGDTLWGIAVLYYGDGTRYPEIAAANNIANPNLIFPGQTFIIP